MGEPRPQAGAARYPSASGPANDAPPRSSTTVAGVSPRPVSAASARTGRRAHLDALGGGNLGQVYLQSGEYKKAELVLGRALKLKPDSPETLYLMARVYSEQTKVVDALDLLVRAHKLAPENTDVIFLLARVSMMQNYFEDAIPLL